MRLSRLSPSDRKRIARIAVPLLAIMGVVALFAVMAILASDASARPGGGSSYSGGSRSSGSSSSRSSGSSGSSGGSGGGFFIAEIIGFLIRLCIDSPAIGIPLVLILLGVVVAVFIAKNREGALNDWSVGLPNASTGDASMPAPPSEREASARPELEELRASDENFSVVLLEDFLAALYVEVHTARGRQALPTMSAYVMPEALAKLNTPGITGVRDVIVGALRFTSVDVVDGNAARDPEARVRVSFELDTNYTEIGPGTVERAYYCREMWEIARKPGVISRAPDRARIFPCPSCGAPLNQVIAGVCRHCGQNVSTGAFDWVVEDVTLMERESRGPMLTGTTEEQGTNLPTVVDREAQNRIRALSAKDPSFDYNAFQARIALIFANFQLGWANRDLAPMRPFFTDNLFSVQAYWVEAYRRQHLRNITERARITNMHLARVTSDKWFDAITVRVFATGLDYTLTDDNRLVAGNNKRERVYSEYWTLVRGSGRKGPTRTEAVCPNCGAPLAVTMAGNCQYCQAKVSSGEFDWVLSRIEQDESYER